MTDTLQNIPLNPEGSRSPLYPGQTIETFETPNHVNIELLHRFTKIGTALSSERDIDRLLEMIVVEAKQLTNADGGTLYVMSPDKNELQFAIVQTSSLNIRMGGTAGEITWSPVSLTMPDGFPNHENVCAHVAITGETVNIEDVYQYEGFNFQGTKNFDQSTGYRSRSMLVVPMKNHENKVIGVLQLLNAMEGKKTSYFSPLCLEITESFASQAAIALSNNRLIHQLENLLKSFIRAIAVAIDEKSPYTGGHVRRVAELTTRIAEKINEMKEGPFADIAFSGEEMEELQMAAWLHDVGKITTPEHVVDKETKLQTIFDRIELVRLRFKLYQARLEILGLKGLVSRYGGKEWSGSENGVGQTEREMQDELNFLEDANRGGEFMSDEKLARIREIATRRLPLDGQEEPLLSEAEVENLSVRRGTLTQSEREIIQNHAVMTGKILSQLPFPEKLKNVPQYAAAHHEALNGKGYPKGLTADELPIQARIIALADIFEALTASDRPYKKGNTLEEALDIMDRMAKDGHIDPDILELFRKGGLPEDYARRELASRDPVAVCR